jgi:hemolysin activation/secretion protein
LSRWEFVGNALFEDAELREVLVSVTGRALSFNQIYSAARAIEAYYAASGYVAQATLPPQEVIAGVVWIKIVEADYAGVEIEGSPPRRVTPEVIQRFVETQVGPGESLRPADFDLPNLLVNDLPGVSVTGAFAPGRNPGETVLLLNAEDGPLVFGQVFLDNSGSRATGRERATLQFGFNSPLGYGDLLRADFAKTQGSESVVGSYAFPLGYRGARVSLNGSVLRYKVITPEIQDLSIAGESLSRGVSVSVPLRRSRDVNVSFNMSHNITDLQNSVRGDVSSDYRVSQTSVGLSGSWRDTFGGSAFSSFGVSLARGSAKGSNNSGAFDTSFDAVRVNLAREQYLSERTALFAGVSAQYGSSGTDTSEQFSLGGPNGVRAYPTGEAGGPKGGILNLEVRHQIDEQWRLTGFYDHGVIAGRDVPGEPTSYQLNGLGARVNWAGPAGWGAEFTWSHRLGSNPNAIADPNRSQFRGNDQDGSLDKNRLWLSVRKGF